MVCCVDAYRRVLLESQPVGSYLEALKLGQRLLSALREGQTLRRTIADDFTFGIELYDAIGLIAHRRQIQTSSAREEIINQLTAAKSIKLI